MLGGQQGEAEVSIQLWGWQQAAFVSPGKMSDCGTWYILCRLSQSMQGGEVTN